MFIRNVWYMAAWCNEVAEQPLGRIILNEPVVLFRDLGGDLGALRDACPHRAVPLSMGTVSNGQIRCPYHGLEFDIRGVCRHNPHVKGSPDRLVDKIYPVVERHGIVWIWMGDKPAADPELIVDYSLLDNPAEFAVSRGYLKIKADYRLAIDNLMDLAHAEYIHPNTLGSPGSTEVEEVKVSVQDSAVTVNTLRPDLPPNAIDKVWWTKTKHVDQYLDMTWRPASNLFLDISITGPGEPRASGLRTPGAHILTPETERSTHYFWAFGRDFEKGNEELSAIITQTVGAAFNAEDSPIIEAAQRMLDLTQMPMMNFTKGDAGSAHVRRAIDRLVSQEQAK